MYYRAYHPQWYLALVGIVITVVPITVAQQNPKRQRMAAERLLESGPEDRDLEARTGTWNVTSTLHLTPDGAPIVANRLLARRKMVGRYLEEVMMPGPNSKEPDFRRIAYLTYFRVEGRYQYVSLDTRFPVGIMPAWSHEKPTAGKLTLDFAPFTFVGMGQSVEGRSIMSNLVITRDGKDHESARQYWTQADGTGRQWLAVEYDYTRAP